MLLIFNSVDKKGKGGREKVLGGLCGIYEQ